MSFEIIRREYVDICVAVGDMSSWCISKPNKTVEIARPPTIYAKHNKHDRNEESI